MPKKEPQFVWIDAELLRIIASCSDQGGADVQAILRMFDELQLADLPKTALSGGLKRLTNAGFIHMDGRRYFINDAARERLPRTKSGKFSFGLGKYLRLLGVVLPWLNAEVTITIHKGD